jgi:hypothetical protein
MTPTPEEITRRLREASRLSSLDASSRLEGKIDMSPAAVTARLREVADLLSLCQRLARRA